MRTILSFAAVSILLVTQCFANHPYFPFTKKTQITGAYAMPAMQGLGKPMFEYTGETKEQDGKTYYIGKNWMESPDGKKSYEMTTLSRVGDNGAVYSIPPMSKTEHIALPAIADIKVGYTWSYKDEKSSTKSEIISLDGTLKHDDLDETGLLVINTSIDGELMLKTYFKKGFGPIAAASFIPEKGETLIFYVKK